MHHLHGWRERLALFLMAVRAYIRVIETTPGPPGLLTSKALRKGIIMNVARSFNNWLKYRQTVNELGRMSHRELQDLGISKSDIHRVARAAAAM